MEFLNKIKERLFPTKQYYKKETNKSGIVVHHTSSGEGVEGDINWWKSTPERVSTPIIISREGVINRLYDSKYWAHHLGIKSHLFRQFGLKPNNAGINKAFIGIEMDSWGGLVKKNGKYYSWAHKKVDPKNVIHYPEGYRGYYYFERYTKEQLASLALLLRHYGAKYDIPLKYKGDVFFKFNERALKGEPGVWAHTSFRPDKSDVHPQPELIELLKSF